MIACTIVTLVTDISWFVPGTGAISFAVLILVTHPQWTGQGTFGWANTITALRLGGILILGLILERLANELIIVVILLLLAGDGVDGWLARRFHQASEFGEYFDKETDAIFMLILSLAIVSTQRLGHWFLIVGLLRYLFVLILHFRQPEVVKEERSNRGRYIQILVMGALIACFLPFPTFYKPFAIVATLILLLSFARDFRWMFSTS
jgi:phosphatidylglycerophosphate synthase